MCDMKKCLEIQLLGGVTVRYGDRKIGMGTANAKAGKMWTLFKYMILNSGRIVSQEELIERLWPEMEVANPANSLKVLIFKLRKELDSLGGIAGSDVVLTADGGYCFNTSAPYVLDIDVFDRYLDEARRCADADEKIRLLLAAVDCYKGNIHVESKRGSWAMPIQTHYCERYEQAVRALAGLLLDRGDCQRVVDICKNALLIQPYAEEFYYYIIRAYTLMKNFGAALDMYREVQRVMSDEFGTRPDARIESAYKEILRQKPRSSRTLKELQGELRETDAGGAAFFVEYEEFSQMYRLAARRLRQISGKSYLCLFSLGAQKGTAVARDVRKAHVGILGEALAFSLQSSDVFCQVGGGQFAALLEDVAEEQKNALLKRIRAAFDKNKKEPGLYMVYQAAAVEAPPQNR